ncbi:type II secretion system GspH family protein [Patescibacteria group bacterium]|nr:type II secretion system GspH family protein [Patescibacteria group bacterium]
MTRQRGFTLIELLVVIAIIGLLAAIVLASLNSARSKGRDSYRATSIRQVQRAFELYADDHKGNYPVFGGWTGMDCASASCDATHQAALNAAFVPTYLPAWPRDPSANGGANDWGIEVSSTASDYTIVTFNSVENACQPKSLVGGYNNKSYVICSGPLSYYCPGGPSYVAQCP